MTCTTSNCCFTRHARQTMIVTMHCRRMQAITHCRPDARLRTASTAKQQPFLL